MSAGLLLVPFLIGLNAFFVAAEYALVAIKGHQVEALRGRGHRRAAAALVRLKRDPASAIGAIQVCITLVNLLLGGLGEEPIRLALQRLLDPLVGVVPERALRIGSFGASFAVVTFLTVVFSEQLPKALTLRYVPTVATFTAQPVLLILRVTWPLVWLMNQAANLVTRPLGLGRVEDAEREVHTAEDIGMIASEAADHGELSQRERSLILNSLALGRRPARAIMVPRVKVAHLDLTKSMEENRRVMNEHLYSRLPLCDGGIDRVIGIVPTREFLAAFHAEGDVSVLQLIARPATFVPDSISLDKLLVRMDEERTQMVVLVDEHGGVEGIVTLRDVVDELVGRPIDVTAAEAARRRDAPAERFVTSGDTPLHELGATLGVDLSRPNSSVVTVGGLITQQLGRFPRSGDEVRLEGGLTLRVVEGDSRVVRRVEVLPAGRAAADAADVASAAAADANGSNGAASNGSTPH